MRGEYYYALTSDHVRDGRVEDQNRRNIEHPQLDEMLRGRRLQVRQVQEHAAAGVPARLAIRHLYPRFARHVRVDEEQDLRTRVV